MRTRLHTLRALSGVALACVLLAAGCAAPAQTGGGAPAAKSGGAAPATTAGTSAPQAAGGPEWDRLVAAARQDGKLTIAIPPGPQYEPALREAWNKAFPGIEIEMVNLIGGQFRARIEKERGAGQYAWDACICGPGADTYRLIEDGAFDPIRDDLILPDVLDDSKWLGGFDARFSDDARQYAFDFGANNSAGGYVNRDLIPESELARYEDLWKPQFRGKIVWQDPRGPGSGVNAATVVIETFGEAKLRELWTQQQVQLSTDDRQMAEWVMRGTRPIAIGTVYNRGLLLLHQEGLAQNVKSFPYPAALAVPGPHAILLVDRPPHPNARKVFANWLLTQEIQALIGKTIGSNSARLDVPVFDPQAEVPKGVPTINPQSEAFVPKRTRANDMAREIFK
jgi:ABC-type Fe3+ transport system substrate-binding protein